jgi:asparaginyl-tRNA synthetase
LTSSDCEGAGEAFTLVNPIIHHPSSSSSSSSTSTSPPERFFPHPVNLTVSSQLHLEAPTHALSRTYTLSPAFRAEPSLTSRHLSEFYMLEAEVAFVETLDQLLEVVEKGIREVLYRLMWEGGRGERTRRDLEVIRDHEPPEELDGATLGSVEPERPPLSHLINASARPFARMTYTSAIAFLQKSQEDHEFQFEHPPIWGQGLSSEHERYIATHHSGPTFITHYPASIKPFYMLPSTADPSMAAEGGEEGDTVACFDLLLPDLGELIGGSMREYRLGPLVTAMKKAGLKEEEYEWYLDLRRFGSVPHGGWGMGWERWICWVTGVSNIRDVVAFPRWKGNCKY